MIINFDLTVLLKMWLLKCMGEADSMPHGLSANYFVDGVVFEVHVYI